jgi:hypothetical protein
MRQPPVRSNNFQPQLKKNEVQIAVLKPIARTTHQPARASQIENAPPRIPPATGSQNIGEERTPSATKIPRTTPPNTEAIPIFNRNALPAAPMLQVNAMK